MPLADFTCVYGSGTYRNRFTDHLPAGGADVIAVAWLNPWCRTGAGRSDVRVAIERPEFVDVPGTPRELRSFWQIESAGDVQMLDDAADAQGRRWRTMRLPSDGE
ncbi:MAG: hypothetical protein QM775_08560 [Pirellulales bacterium]